MKKFSHNRCVYLLITLICCSFFGNAQMIDLTEIIPDNTATHKTINSGNWNDPNTWDTGSVPGLASIVVIRMGDTINYNVNSNAHIFAIRNEGLMRFRAPRGSSTKLIVDTFFCGMMSELDMKANSSTDGTIDIHFKPFNIEQKKSGGIAGATWNNQARNHYSDGRRVNNHFNQRLANDGPGVLGRYEWDPEQASLGLMTMGKVTILGQEKTSFLRTTEATPRRDNNVVLESMPENWEVGDQVVLSGTQGIFRVQSDGIRTQDEEFLIEAINGNEITFDRNTVNTHQGIPEENLFSHLSNLSRNITFKSIDFTDNNNNVNDDITRRGHTMFMRTTNVKIHYALFKDLGRSNKHNILDDFKYNLRRTGRTDEDGKPFVEIENFVEEPALPQNIENQRGRYSMHFHRMKDSQTRMAEAHGLAVWGSPGWGMVHHDSHASFTNSVVYFIDGSGMVAESGSETGIWKDNLVTTARPDGRNYYFADMDRDAPSALNAIVSDLLDDDFRIGEAYGLQGRAVRMVNNVAASSREAFAYDGGGTVVGLRDKVRADIYGDLFPLQEFVDPAAAPLLEFRDNEAYGCSSGFRSKDRTAQAYHHQLSIIDNHKTWNVRRAMYITTNFGYMVRNSKHWNGDSAGLIGGDVDNLCIVNGTFYNWTNDGFTDGRGTGASPDHQLNFINVRFPGFPTPRIYRGLDRTNDEVFGNEVFDTNVPIELARNSQMDTQINVDRGDFKLVVSGTITDRLGSYPFGHSYSRRFPAIRERIYDFETLDKLEDYLNRYGIEEDSRGVYTTLTEFITDRGTGETIGVDIRINIIGLNPEDYRTNEAPTLTVLQPTDDTTTLFAGEDIVVRAEADDPDGIKEVRLYVNGELIRVDTEAPYSWGGNSSLQNVTEGRYRIKVVAIDNTGRRTKKIILLNVLPTALRDAGFDKENTSALMITPNPTTGSNVTVYQKGNLYLKLYDITGKEIMKLDVNSNELNLDVSDLSSGLYIIKSDKISRKFIVK